MNRMDEARLEIAETRAHLHETAEELGAALSQRTEAVKQRVSPAHYAREYPWAALGVAVGIGLAIGLAGADTRAAAAVASGATAAKDKIASRLDSGAADDAEVDVTPEPAIEEPREPGIRERIAAQVDGMLADGLNDFLNAVGVRSA